MMADSSDIDRAARDIPAVRDHSRSWRENRYVYPVLSRRSKGLSIGINLQPNKSCNFRCVYCQVNRREVPTCETVELGTLIRELNAMLDSVVEGRLWRTSQFASVPAALRRVNDVAFSGDGEPTAYRKFPAMVQVVADAKARHRLKDVKIVVISNASRFHTQTFRRAMPTLLANRGEVWAKLDAGSAERFVRINRTKVPFKRVLANIEWLAQQMPIVIQSCFFRLDGAGPGEAEMELYIARLRRVLELGGRIKCVQVHTIARPPTEGNVTFLDDESLRGIVTQIRDALGTVSVEAFFGVDVGPQRP